MRLSGVKAYEEHAMHFPFFGNSAEKRLRQECTEWFLLHRHRLLAYALRQGDDMTDAEHLLSAVSGKVVEVFCRGRVPAAEWMPYTLRAIHNEATTLRRLNARRLETERRYTQEQETLRESDTEDEQVQQLKQGLCHLNFPQQELIRLRIWEELTFAEIGQQLGIPESTARLRYTTALNLLRQHLKGGLNS